jgi:hypothetical protein
MQPIGKEGDLTDEEVAELLRLQYEKQQAESSVLQRRARAVRRIEVTYGRLLAKSWVQVEIHLWEAADCLWRLGEYFVRLIRLRSR